MDLFNSIDDLVGGTPVFKVCDNCFNNWLSNDYEDILEDHQCLQPIIDDLVKRSVVPESICIRCDCRCRTIDG